MELTRRQQKRDKMRDLQKVRRQKVTILEHTEKREYGSIVLKWEPWKTVWARRISLWGQAYFAARAVGEEQTVEFEVQWTPFLKEINTVDHRFELDGVQYEIKHVDHLRDDGEWVKFRCLEVAERTVSAALPPEDESGNGDENDENDPS